MSKRVENIVRRKAIHFHAKVQLIIVMLIRKFRAVFNLVVVVSCISKENIIQISNFALILILPCGLVNVQ